jgi:hypothetical protein
MLENFIPSSTMATEGSVFYAHRFIDSFNKDALVLQGVRENSEKSQTPLMNDYQGLRR